MSKFTDETFARSSKVMSATAKALGKALYGKKSRRKADDGLTEKTLAYLATQHDVWAERRNSGSKLIPKEGGGFYRIHLGEPGTPDICLLIRLPRQHYSMLKGEYETTHVLVYAGIETKCKGGKLNPAQRKFHEKAAKWGMPCCTVETLEDVKLFLEGLRR